MACYSLKTALRRFDFFLTNNFIVYVNCSDTNMISQGHSNIKVNNDVLLFGLNKLQFVS